MIPEFSSFHSMLDHQRGRLCSRAQHLTSNRVKKMAPEKKNARKTTPQHSEKCEKITDKNTDKTTTQDVTHENLTKIEALTNGEEALRVKFVSQQLTDTQNQLADTQQQLMDAFKRIQELEAERLHQKKEIDSLNDDVINSLVHEREEILELRDKENKKLGGKVKDLETERSELKKEINNLNDEREELHEWRRKETIKIAGRTKELEDERESLKNHLNHMDKGLQNEARKPISESKTGKKKEYSTAENENEKTAVRDDELLIYNDSGITIDLINDVKTELNKCMDNIVDKKLSEILLPKKKNWPQIHERASNKGNTYRVNHNTNMGPKREQNVIIHGVNEGDYTDTDYLTKLFYILEMDHIAPPLSYRLGVKNCKRPRPVKVIMKSVEEKEQLMSRLALLRYAKDEFKKISVTEDYTIEEREEIRRWVMMANNKNTNEKTDARWKVRGTPKIGLRLIRI